MVTSPFSFYSFGPVRACLVTLFFRMTALVPPEWEPLTLEEIDRRDKILTLLGPDKLNHLSEAFLIQFVRGYAREADPVASAVDKLRKALVCFDLIS